MQLEGDAEVEVDIEGVVVGDERAGGGAPLDALQHRRLHLPEPLLAEVLADGVDGLDADLEDALRVLVDDQIDVALPVSRLEIGEGMALLGQRADALAQELEGLDLHRQLAGVGRHHRALHADDVAPVEVIEAVVLVGPDDVSVDKELHVTRTVV